MKTLNLLLVLTLFVISACKPAYNNETNQPMENENKITSRLVIYDLDSSTELILHESNARFEAPNWSNDDYLYFNQEGSLFKISVKGDDAPKKINLGGLENINNDHGISPDGTRLVISNNDPNIEGASSRIYTLPIEGGRPYLVTENAPSYWHGWSPDGQTLAYVANRGKDYNIMAISVQGGKEYELTSEMGLDDGPDYSPDGNYIYFNSVRTGSMEIWRMDADGKNPSQLTNDKLNNWFPHPSPDGKKLLFISYISKIDPSAHPADKQVKLRLMDLVSGKIEDLTEFTGGQGSINVPNWAPDSKRFAYVRY